jgi:hypothetical protein
MEQKLTVGQECTRTCGGYHALPGIHVFYRQGEDSQTQYVSSHRHSHHPFSFQLVPDFSSSYAVRTLLDYFNPIPDSKEIQINVLVDNIDWAKREKRIFLKHSLETRLVAL